MTQAWLRADYGALIIGGQTVLEYGVERVEGVDDPVGRGDQSDVDGGEIVLEERVEGRSAGIGPGLLSVRSASASPVAVSPTAPENVSSGCVTLRVPAIVGGAVARRVRGPQQRVQRQLRLRKTGDRRHHRGRKLGGQGRLGGLVGEPRRGGLGAAAGAPGGGL